MTQFAEIGWMNNLVPHLKAIYAFPPVICSRPHMALAQSPSVVEGVCGLGLHPEPRTIIPVQQRGQLRAGDGDGEGWEQEEEPLTPAQLYVAAELRTRNAALVIRCVMFSMSWVAWLQEVPNAVCRVLYSSRTWRLGWEQDFTLTAATSKFDDGIWWLNLWVSWMKHLGKDFCHSHETLGKALCILMSLQRSWADTGCEICSIFISFNRNFSGKIWNRPESFPFQKQRPPPSAKQQCWYWKLKFWTFRALLEILFCKTLPLLGHGAISERGFHEAMNIIFCLYYGLLFLPLL